LKNINTKISKVIKLITGTDSSRENIKLCQLAIINLVSEKIKEENSKNPDVANPFLVALKTGIINPEDIAKAPENKTNLRLTVIILFSFLILPITLKKSSFEGSSEFMLFLKLSVIYR